MKDVLQDTKNIMKQYNIRANKSLGQNFLIDQNVIENIVECSDISKQDLIIEIGPGLGTLTEYLIEKAMKVICVELDKRMVDILSERFKECRNLEIINQDILKINLQELIKNEKQKNQIKNVKIVANLPYYITTPIIMKLLEEKLELETITVMIQKEVAERLIATPGEKLTGAITYAVNYYSEGEGIIDVSRDSFIPRPEVTSKVIKLKIRKEAPVKVKNEKLMFEIIKTAFMQKRKTLLNALTNAKVFMNKNEGIEILKKVGIDVNSRPENLTLDNYAEITNILILIYRNSATK